MPLHAPIAAGTSVDYKRQTSVVLNVETNAFGKVRTHLITKRKIMARAKIRDEVVMLSFHAQTTYRKIKDVLSSHMVRSMSVGYQ
jgi:hypothetical protein